MGNDSCNSAYKTLIMLVWVIYNRFKKSRESFTVLYG